MWLSVLKLTAAALLPVLATVIFHYLEKFTKFKKIPYWPKQIIFGVIFGGLAIVGTHWAIQYNVGFDHSYPANARDAAVIIGGLIFGSPAGIIAGTIGGLERMIVGIVNPTNFGFTVIACSISTFLAGVFSALIRHFAFENKRPGVFSGFFTGLIIEVFHLLMVFVIKANEYQKAYEVIATCTAPMLIANSVAVLLALLIKGVLERGKLFFKRPDLKSLTSRFTYTLSTLTFIAFILSSTFVFLFDSNMSTKQRDNDLKYAITETANEVANKTVQSMSKIRDSLTNYPHKITQSGLTDICNNEGLVEINVVDHTGHIWHSSEPRYDEGDFNMGDYEQSREFLCLLDPNGPETFVQNFRKMADTDVGEERKYVGIKFTFTMDDHQENGFIQCGYDKAGVARLLENIALYKKIGNSGSLLVLNDNYRLISKGIDFKLPEDFSALQEGIYKNKNLSTFTVEMNGTSYYAQYIFEDAHFTISLIPTSEADLSRNISVFINTFLEVIVFGLFFVTIYVLVKKLVIDRIEMTNESLAKITAGKLDTIVEGGNITEFKVLSKDINETVDALKGYIDAANKRIDEELALAKAIQSAVLPSTFPAFPDRKEFDIYASMHPAKEVGGDFYDFYFSNQKDFHFTIADVSGKGIPAALFMMRAKSILKSLTQTNIPINEAFIQGNDALCEGNEAGMFVTAWSSSVDLTNGELTFANGGHNPPLIKHKDGKFEYLKAPVNLVLAAMDGMPYGINKLQLKVGDIVYLYTDGVTEGVNTKGEQLGEERLQQILNSREFDSCKELCEYVYGECVKFADGAAQFDDITMVAFRFDGFKK